jgi:hypothetical protein
MISAETDCWKMKKIAKFLMRTFTYRSTFLYGASASLPNFPAKFRGFEIWLPYQQNVRNLEIFHISG